MLGALRRGVASLLDPKRPARERTGQPAAPSREYRPLRRLVLADDVNRTLFGEFAAHRETERGSEETGWVLLGLRGEDEAVVLATVPAGAMRDSSDTHVRFNPVAQGFASRIVRRGNRQLTTLGVVHTHPGSMRHPSDGDYRGDVEWVKNLRGQEGVFGIGTADAKKHPPGNVAWQPSPNVQCLGPLCFSWYSLAAGDRNYRALPVDVTLGPDLALELRPVWEELENHAERLERIARQLTRVEFSVIDGREKPALAVQVPLADSEKAIRVLIEGKEVRYLLVGPSGAMMADFHDDRVDHGIFVMLAELTS